MSYSIDISRETMIAIADVPGHMEKLRIKRPHHNVVRRWTRRGGRGIPLPSVLVGIRRYTSHEAIVWWVNATSVAGRGGEKASEVRYPMSAQTRRTLVAAGLIDA